MMLHKNRLQFDPFPAIAAEAFKHFFALEELANRTIEGGWELLFRNFLIRELGRMEYFSLEDSELDRETTVVPKQGKGGHEEDKAKISDIAVIRRDAREIGCEKHRAIFEIKHNFSTQPEVFKELKGAMEKWKAWRKDKDCEFHYIQIVTDIRRLAGSKCGNEFEGCCIYPEKNKKHKGERCKDFCSSLCAEVFKYGIQPDDDMRKARMEAIHAHFDLLQKCLDPDFEAGARVRKFSVASKKYFSWDVSYEADVFVFLISQRAVSQRARAGLLFDGVDFPGHAQVALLNFSKGRKGRMETLDCPESP